MTTTDSNLRGGHSGHTYTFTHSPNGTTGLDVVVVREGKNVSGRARDRRGASSSLRPDCLGPTTASSHCLRASQRLDHHRDRVEVMEEHRLEPQVRIVIGLL